MLAPNRVEDENRDPRFVAQAAALEAILPISGPLFVRVIGITPAMTGTPSVLGTANHESGVGAILDFSSGLTGPLASGTTSRPKRVTLQLSPEQWVTVHQTRARSFSQADGGDDPSYNVFPRLDLRVYGHL